MLQNIFLNVRTRYGHFEEQQHYFLLIKYASHFYHRLDQDILKLTLPKDGWGVHTYRLVTNEGATVLVKWHWKSLQGKASFLWEEAQATGGKNSDFHRQDMWNAIEAGLYPEWEVRFLRMYC